VLIERRLPLLEMRFTFSRFGFVCPDVCTTAAFCRVSPQEKEEEEEKAFSFFF
jgi:hypothetical protein